MKIISAIFLLGSGMSGLSLPLLAQSSVSVPVVEVAGRAYQLPDAVSGVRRSVISLNGQWDFRYDAKSRWTNIRVPGEAAMQGYAIAHDRSFFYRRSFTLPADYAGQRAILRFDGVYSHARLTVNGHFVREHHGGFSRWEADITPYVRPGRKVEIMLEVQDRMDDPSYAAGYAHHPIGGILRDVTLFAQPVTHLYDAYFETHLDSAYTDGHLRFVAHLADADAQTADEVRFTLTDPTGRQVNISGNDRLALRQGKNEASIPVGVPQLWDAEHPRLYTVRVGLYSGGKEVSAFTRRIGFRNIRVDKDRLLVNGRAVKLRGACRHDVHPTMGRSTNRELDSLDVVRFKEANMNFVRTSHYPPSENFLEFCDRYGIYVESETAVCFVNTYRQKNFAPGASQNDSAFAPRYLGQLQEMVKSHRSHPSVLLWSIGNESQYGRNFQLSYDWLKANDPTRPVIFSYPGSAREAKANVFDILSMHYQDVNGNLDQWGMQTRGFQGEGIPALFDEWAHPACYTYSTLQTDPGIREFWGESIDRMWEGLFASRGGLGGAIWCYSDETFALPEPKVGEAFWKEFHRTAKPEDCLGREVGYGEWGIVDVWRRYKPEFWATKKGYSPIRLLSGREIAVTPGQPVMLTVLNRFDHTNFDEIRATVIYRGKKHSAQLSAASPRQKATLQLPALDWREGETVRLEFYDVDGQLFDAEELALGHRPIDWPKPLAAGAISVEETGEHLIVRGKGFEIPVSRSTGLIEHARVGSKEVIEKGPYLNLYVNHNHLTGAEVRSKARYYAADENDWRLGKMNVSRSDSTVTITVDGTYKETNMHYTLHITERGSLSVNYRVDGAPNGYLREAGLAFRLPDGYKNIDWQRRGYWSCYPDNSFAGNTGTAPLYPAREVAYGEHPDQPWHYDNREYFYWADRGANCDRPITRAAKGMKENIYVYTLSDKNRHGFSVVSRNASVACRINTCDDSSLILYANNRWDYPEIAWGNYCKTIEALPCYGEINIQLN